ncbi:hypothetical protein [Candidatus Xianfuyuplasma coldseepsis]|uniref:Uncharacterized protein n=1 Tax=Candidatus Xianfuyuplasma coldseepsis TaxID=2782163 RepID=A0A7L7KTE0_9MOLU|nr:hypothetical protein [Xianfuyuplasma coldseepsis]QMS85506.1 hypothetical protein G4Z02_07045 [Xianfuyuplasma coldseepsis]
MRLLVLGSLLLSSGTAVAMQNETVQEEAGKLYQRARYHVVRRFQGRLVDTVQESGFPYPPESYLENLTEEQQTAVLTTIDKINAEYDWANMSEEEIIDALHAIRDEMQALYEELGIEGPTLRERIREAIQHRRTENVRENGIQYPREAFLDTLTEEQQTALTTVIDTANATYDWATMTDEEIETALQTVHEELQAVADEYGFELPTFQDRFQHMQRPWHRHRMFDEE